MNAHYIAEEFSQPERLKKLNALAISQMKVFLRNISVSRSIEAEVN